MDQSQPVNHPAPSSSLAYLMNFLVLLGLGISSYLLYTSLTGSEIVCAIGQCGIVNNSKYAYLLGLPVSGWGAFYYTSLLVLLALKKQKLFFALSVWGFIFSSYLTYIEGYVIHAWCQWCLFSAWITYLIFFFNLYHWWKQKKAL